MKFVIATVLSLSLLSLAFGEDAKYETEMRESEKQNVTKLEKALVGKTLHDAKDWLDKNNYKFEIQKDDHDNKPSQVVLYLAVETTVTAGRSMRAYRIWFVVSAGHVTSVVNAIDVK